MEQHLGEARCAPSFHTQWKRMTRNQRMPLAGPDTSGDPLGGQVSRRHTTTGITFFTDFTE